MLSAFPFFSDFFLSPITGCTIVLLVIVEIERPFGNVVLVILFVFFGNTCR